MTAQDVFEGGLAVITGAGSGVGEGLARYAASVGMRVVIADIDEPAAVRVRDVIRATGAESWSFAVDVRDADRMDSLARFAAERGSVRLLVNNAGVEQFGYLWDTPVQNWRRIVDININGVFHGIRSFVPAMIAQGVPAHVWNVASVGALTHIPWQAPYLMSKQAVLGMTEALRVDLDAAGSNVHVGVVMPAAVASNIFTSAGGVDGAGEPVAEAAREQMMTLVPTATDPFEAAAEIFSQAARGEFYLLPQEEYALALLHRRGAQLGERRTPRARTIGSVE